MAAMVVAGIDLLFHLLVNGFSVIIVIIIHIITSSDGFSQSVLKQSLHHL